jgi:hypothetical protein
VNRPTPPPPTKGKPAAKADGGTKIPTKETPAAPPPAAGGGNDDDDVAAMLLSLQDDGEAPSGLIPEGSTVFDMAAPPPPGSGPAADKPKTEAEKEKEKAKLLQGNTSSAAKQILEKMMRRPRT